ncbi:MAG: hypothetical protein ACM3X4_06110 [Ignavibacteriales bacterium]
MVLMYEAMLSCAVRQKEAAERGDMEAFEREAAERQNLAVRIDEVSSPLLADRAGSGAAIDEARALALKIAGVDAESGRLIEKARADLVRAMSRVGSERKCIAAYGSVIGFDDKDPAFVDRLK